MAFTLTESQKQRLRELDADVSLNEKIFDDPEERDRTFKDMEKKLIKEGKQRLINLRNINRRPVLCELEGILVETLTAEGFVQMITPITLARGLLEKMSITSEHPLGKQVFWVSRNRCLRPMLAPNLYYLLKKLVRLWAKPIRIFEVGPCFRKESKGSHHLEEFTMLNLVELGLAEDRGYERLKELAALIMNAVGIDKYQFIHKKSEVYGETVDIVANIEVCSGAMGPHPLDDQWGIFNPWVGLGFGLERIVMVKQGYRNIQRVGRSLGYIDGVRLNI